MQPDLNWLSTVSWECHISLCLAFTVLRRFYITGFPAPLCTTHKVCTQIYFKSLASTISPPGQTFNELTLSPWEDSNFRPPIVLTGTLPLSYKTSILEVSICKLYLLNHSGICALPLWILKVLGISLNSLQKLFILNQDYFVTPTGLEPVTRTLKVCCATNCATESFHIFQILR